MKLLAVFILFASMSFKAHSAAKIGPFNVDLQFCKDYEKWSGIISSYSNVQFPVTGAPGITMGMMQNTSVIVDFCSYMTQMANLDTQGQIWKTAEMGNKLADNRFSEEMELATGYFDMFNAAYDFNNKKGRTGAFQAAADHRRLNNLARKTTDYIDKNYRQDDPINLQTRQESERDMARLSRIAYNRAIIKEATTCPKPKDNTEYDKIYEKDILPREEANEVLKEYTNFYREALLSMGPKFLMKEEYSQYVDDLNAVASKSTSYRAEVKSRSAETTKIREKSTKPIKATESKTEEYMEKITLNYQEFQPLPDPKPLRTFLQKYESKWAVWVKMQTLQTSRGLLANPTKRVEDEFKDYSIICNRGKYAQQFSRSDPQYTERVNTAVANCKTQSVDVIQKSGGLFSYYAQDLVQKDRQIKTNQSLIWTKESFVTGNMRNITESINQDVIGSFTQQEVQCSPIKNLAVMNQLQLKQQAANAELNQIMVEQLFKQNSIKEAELAKKRKDEEEAVRRAHIEKEMQNRKDFIGDDLAVPDAKRIGF